MPAYNSEKYISEALESVVQQTYENWELIIINDGSTDNTEEVINTFSDSRIIVIKQANQGVSAARNKGLAQMKGKYFCFLDADDIYPKRSLESRVNLFQNSKDLSFVDGRVISKNETLTDVMSVYQPSFKGEPIRELARLKNTCLLGNTWMVKREEDIDYQFAEGLTHAEDLSFYLTICENKKYDFVEDEILWYRRNEGSAMSDLNGLGNGYEHVYRLVKSMKSVPANDLAYLKKRIIRIMFLSWLIDGKNPIKAISSFFKYVGL